MDIDEDCCDILQYVQLPNHYVVLLKLMLHINCTSVRTHVNRNKDIHILSLNSRICLITRHVSLWALTASAAVECGQTLCSPFLFHTERFSVFALNEQLPKSQPHGNRTRCKEHSMISG